MTTSTQVVEARSLRWSLIAVSFCLLTPPILSITFFVSTTTAAICMLVGIILAGVIWARSHQHKTNDAPPPILNSTHAETVLLAHPTPSGIVNANQEWEMANSALLTLLGMDLPTLLGHPHPELEWLLAPRSETTESNTIDSWIVNLDVSPHGRRCLRVHRLVLEALPPRFLIAVEDVTDLESAREELEKQLSETQQKSTTQTGFIATLAHEVRTPLQAMSGVTDFLASEPLSTSQMSLVETLRTSQDHMLAMVDSLLQLARLENGTAIVREEPFSIETLIRDAGSLFSPLSVRNGGSLDVSIQEIPHLLGDPIRIRQILNNLLGNAVRHAGMSHILLMCRIISKTSSNVLLSLEVADAGPGFDTNNAPWLFQKWQKGTPTGTGSGLGLSIVKHLSQELGGRVEVWSEPGQGATFRVTLPFQIAPSIAPPALANPPSSVFEPSTGLHILVAEDNKTNQLVILRQLQKMGHTPTLAENGQKAVDLWMQEPWDMILMDCQMPVLDGFEATRKIRAMEQKNSSVPTPIVAVTALTLQAEKDECIASGMNDVLTKPVRYERLAEAIISHTRRPTD